METYKIAMTIWLVLGCFNGILGLVKGSDDAKAIRLGKGLTFAVWVIGEITVLLPYMSGEHTKNFDFLVFSLLGLLLCISLWRMFRAKELCFCWLICAVGFCSQLPRYGDSFQAVLSVQEPIAIESEAETEEVEAEIGESVDNN